MVSAAIRQGPDPHNQIGGKDPGEENHDAYRTPPEDLLYLPEDIESETDMYVNLQPVLINNRSSARTSTSADLNVNMKTFIDRRGRNADSDYDLMSKLISEANFGLSEAYADLRRAMVTSVAICGFVVLMTTILLNNGLMTAWVAVLITAAFAGLAGVLMTSLFRLNVS